MSREEEFDKMMASLFEMARYISVYENTPRRYQTQNLYMTEVHAISLIAHREGLNLTQLAKLTNRTKGAISQMIEKLRKRGLVEKLPNAQNASELLLHLTDDGWAVYHYHQQLEQRIYQTFLERMPAFSSQDFHRCFEVLEGIKQAASSRWNKK